MNKRTTSFLAGAVLFGTVAALAIPDAHGIEGNARVIDGDTLDINGTRIRLWGVDAFEHNQICLQVGQPYSCGRAATQTTEEQVRNQHVRCNEKDKDRYGRTVAQCFVGTQDIGQALVLRGWAFDYTRYSHGYYKDAENGAHDAGRGAWGGTFQYPWDFRHGGRK